MGSDSPETTSRAIWCSVGPSSKSARFPILQPGAGSEYHDADGLRFRMAVKCVNKLSDQDAIFSGQIISASDTSYVDQWLLIGVHDGGSPGSKGDTIGGEFFSDDPGCENPPAGEPANVDRGNLVVH